MEELIEVDRLEQCRNCYCMVKMKPWRNARKCPKCNWTYIIKTSSGTGHNGKGK